MNRKARKKRKRINLLKRIHNRIRYGSGYLHKAARRYKRVPARYCNRCIPGHLRNAGRYARRGWSERERAFAEG